MSFSFTSFFDYTVNGLIIGNIYALLAVGLALIFGVSHLINFAHGSVYTVGAYIGWAAITFLHTPLPVTILLAVLGSGALGLLIAGIGLASAALLFGFLRFTKLGWAVRATAQDRDAAQQMGVDVNRVNQSVFAIASALGGLSGLLVGMYYNNISPAMSFQATLKGVVATVVGGVGNVPGAITGSMLLGLTESYGVALFGTPYRNLFAFVLLLVILVWKPNGLFGRKRALPPEPLTGTFIAPSKPWRVPPWLLAALFAAAVVLPLFEPSPYVLQVLTNSWLYGALALSLTLVAGTIGQISLGHAGLLAIGAYASSLLVLDLHLPVGTSIILAGLLTSLIGTALIFPAFRLRGHYVSIATLGIGEIVALTILNWESLTHGPIGVSGIPPLSLFGQDASSNNAFYWAAFGAMVLLALLQWRLLRSHLGRTFRAVREDEVAARAYGVSPDRYKAMAFGFGGFAAGVSGAFTAHLYSYINHETFGSQISILALTMVILGGLGNISGALLGAVALVSLPELFRVTAECRMLIYGIALLVLIRFRPQGLLGTV